ncbi:MAG: OmpA family protein, partial [Candidatus Egerieousia sp.]|nr:OmpA family protein [Candidatus Egerieousia sp.]
LVEEGVNPDQLQQISNGGTENMFGKNYLQRLVIMEVE